MIYRVSLALCCALFGLSAHANDTRVAATAGAPLPVTPAVDALTAANNALTFSVGVGTQSYHEVDDSHVTGDPWLDSESGVLPALRLEASRQGSVLGLSNVYTALSLTSMGGPEHYTGYQADPSYSDGIGAPLSFYDGTLNLDLTLKLGRAFRPTPRAQLIPYVMLGMHDWLRGSGDLENYRHGEAGLGLLTQFAVTPKLVASVDVMAGRTFEGHMNSMCNGNISRALGSSDTRTVGLGLDYAYSKQ